MSIRKARQAFEEAWRLANADDPPKNPALVKMIEGLGELAKGLEDRLDAIKAQVDRVPK